MANTDSSTKIFWQAHRGGGAYEAPDNTMAANRYAWSLGGIPEADIRTTLDGVIVCLHDDTPARTTTAPDDVKDRSISTFTFEEIRTWDAGVKFDEKFKGERIPSLEEAFAEMRGKPERMMYLDLKKVDLDQLGRMIDQYGVNRQVIFTHNVQANCIRMKDIAEGVRTMLWIMGDVEKIKRIFTEARDSGFQGLDQVQLHFRMKNTEDAWPFEIDREFLAFALSETKNAGIDLEIFLYSSEPKTVHLLLDQGVRWFATDEPGKFMQSVRSWSPAVR